jgi:hypothetical protein
MRSMLAILVNWVVAPRLPASMLTFNAASSTRAAAFS